MQQINGCPHSAQLSFSRTSGTWGGGRGVSRAGARCAGLRAYPNAEYLAIEAVSVLHTCLISSKNLDAVRLLHTCLISSVFSSKVLMH